ncbi:unnamed protein product [Soboliphyme baturini]|uniref:Transposase n=1 Tax=Soboliphyme baturini TaxID=241478 RepID=A0A183IH28_9BILA|nr:unnamed protein product [Soboliphyme baturini]
MKSLKLYKALKVARLLVSMKFALKCNGYGEDTSGLKSKGCNTPLEKGDHMERFILSETSWKSVRVRNVVERTHRGIVEKILDE